MEISQSVSVRKRKEAKLKNTKLRIISSFYLGIENRNDFQIFHHNIKYMTQRFFILDKLFELNIRCRSQKKSMVLYRAFLKAPVTSVFMNYSLSYTLTIK